MATAMTVLCRVVLCFALPCCAVLRCAGVSGVSGASCRRLWQASDADLCSLDRHRPSAKRFYRQQQPLLDRFVFATASTPYTIRDLERDSAWASTWGYDINSGYSKIFAYARQVRENLLGVCELGSVTPCQTLHVHHP